MAIRNDNIGGTDWSDGEVLDAGDLNDTNDEIITRLQDTSSGHDHDGVDSKFLPGYLLTQGYNSYQILKQVGTFDNAYPVCTDIFTDSNGANDTINTGNTGATYNSDTDVYILASTDTIATGTTHDPDTFSNPENAFDGNDNSFAQETRYDTADLDVYIGKTFSSRAIHSAKVKARWTQDAGGGGAIGINAKLQTYDGATWTDVPDSTFMSDGGEGIGWDISYDGLIDVGVTCQGLRIAFFGDRSTTNRTTQHYVYTLEGYEGYDSTSDIESNTLMTLDGTEKVALLYVNGTFPADTSATVDFISSGGGSVTGATINEPVNVSSLAAGDLSFDLNLATTDTSVTPEISGYSLVIVR